MAWSLEAAQQALSEKFGIPTFTVTGQVSTIPKTVPLNEKINVGTGSSGLTISAFNDLIKRFTPVKATVPTQEVFSGINKITYTTPKDSKLVEGEITLPERNILPSISTTIQQYTPYIILGGLGLLALTLLKR